jgi:cytochrome c-type biogenesis protein CcmE
VRRTCAILALGLIVAVVTLDLVVNRRTAEDVLKVVVGTVYRSFAAAPTRVEHVDHAAAHQSSRSTEPRLVRLHGYVDAIERRTDGAGLSPTRNGYSVQVSYAGPIPRAFAEGNQVIVTGELRGSDQLHATQIATRVGD